MSEQLKGQRQRAREIIEQLTNLDNSKKPAGGVHGQVIGCEPYTIRTTGDGLQCLREAGALLDDLLDPFGRRAPASEPAVDRDAVADTGLPELRQYLKHAGIAGVTLSHSAAWALYSAMTYGASAPAVPAAPLVASECNFCERCGKRLSPGSIHTCTPPAELAPQGAQASPEPIDADLLLLKLRETGIISGFGAESLFYGEKVGFTLSDLLKILRATGTDTSQGDA